MGVRGWDAGTGGLHAVDDGRPRFDPSGASLTDSQGAALPSTGGYGVVGHCDVLGVTLPPGENTNITIFASPAGAAQAATLTLPLSLSAAEYAPPMVAPSAATPVVAGNIPQAQPALALAMAGLFEFDFQVPVVQAR